MPRLPEENSGSIALKASAELKYQGQVEFDYDFEGSLKNPRIYVEAFQGDDLIYGEAGRATSTFTLGGGGSEWVYEHPNEPADCVATLFYFKVQGHDREWSGRGQQEYVPLARMEFHAEG